MEKKKVKECFKKYGIFGFVLIAIIVLAVAFYDNYSNNQPGLKINVGARIYDAINQPLVVETLFDKTTNEYDSPLETIEQRKYEAIVVNKNQKIILETEKISGIKTSLVPPNSNSINFKIWKEGENNNLKVLDGSIYDDNNKYRISMIAPQEAGEYVVSLNLDYNKSKMRYTFKLSVNE